MSAITITISRYTEKTGANASKPALLDAIDDLIT